jgi:CRP-like cAMP-binding protein
MSGMQPDLGIVFKKNQVIFREGDKADHFYILSAGKVRVVKKHGERLIPLAIYGERDILGVSDVFTNKKRSISAIACENSTLLKIDKTNIDQLFAELPSWVNELVKTLSLRHSSAWDLIASHAIVSDQNETKKQSLSIEEEILFKSILA